MSPRFSVYLDAFRYIAALTVLISHFAYERFTEGRYIIVRELNLGSDAVVLFFVLSGLVIAFTASTKDAAPRRYLFNRATRIVSVALPALVLTFALDRIGASLNPAAYDGLWYAERSLFEMAFFGLSFSSEWQIPGIRLGSNGPFWSLSYEVAYYLIFAAAIFMSGAVRIVTLALLAFLVGLRVLLLLPVWLVGVALWQFLKRDRIAVSRGLAVSMIVPPPLLYAVLLGLGAPAAMFAATAALFGVDPQLLRAFLGFSDEFAWNFLIGLLAAVHLLGVAAYLRDRTEAATSGISAAIRWLAGASFSIYLVHYPVLQFLDAVLPEAPGALSRDAVLLSLTLVICFLFASLFERPLRTFRQAVLGVRAALRSQTGLQRSEPNV